MKMEANKMIGMVVGVMVGVLILSAALFPVIDSATTTERTFTNDGYFMVDSTDDDFTFSWDYDDPTTYVINGDDMTFVNSYNVDLSVVMSESFFIRSDRNGVSVYFNGDGVGNVIANSTNKTLTVSRSAGTITATNGDVTKTLTDTSTIYYMSDSGEYVMKKTTSPAYMLEDSLIFARGYSTLPGPTYTPILIEGDIENGVTASASNVAVTLSDISVNNSTVSGYIGLYSLTDITMTGTVSGTDSTITYNYFVIPATVTVELAVHASQDEIEILETIPILITVGLILGIVGAVFVRRLE